MILFWLKRTGWRWQSESFTQYEIDVLNGQNFCTGSAPLRNISDKNRVTDRPIQSSQRCSLPVLLTQLMLLLTSSVDCPTAHTVNVYRAPGWKILLLTVTVFSDLLSSSPWPTSLYRAADTARLHVNVSESFVELTKRQSPEIRGPKSKCRTQLSKWRNANNVLIYNNRTKL